MSFSYPFSVLCLLRSLYDEVWTLEDYLKTVITDPQCLSGLRQPADKSR